SLHWATVRPIQPATASCPPPPQRRIARPRPSSQLRARRPRNPPRPTLFPYSTLFRSLPVDQLRARDGGTRRGLRRPDRGVHGVRSEEHTSELQSRENLVCRLLLEKKN